jgi:hypothetical protein
MRHTHLLPQVEPSVLRRLFLGRQRHLRSVLADSPLTVELRTQMQADMTRACQPLRDYVAQFYTFLDFLNLDLTEYLRSYEERDYSLAEDRNQIERMLAEKQRVLDDIPQVVGDELAFLWIL